MARKNQLFCLSFASLLLILTTAPAFANDDDDARNDLAKEILSLTADDSCDTDEQCKSIGLGDKPCGGFAGYRIYSLKSVDEPTLIAKVTQYNQMDKENNLKNKIAGTCETLLQPTTSCVQGQCTSTSVDATIY